MIAVNTRAPFFLIQDAAKIMIRENIEGRIINIGSMSEHAGQPFLCPYATSKGALATLTRNVGFALMRNRIHVNQLSIGWMNSDHERKLIESETGDPNFIDRKAATKPFKRILDPKEVAKAVLWMASDNLLPGPPQEVLDKIKATQTEKKEKTFIVSAVEVKNDNTDIVVRASGVTEPIYSINVIARRSGVVTDIFITEGMNVKKGQIIARLDRENLDIDLEAAISAEKSAQQSFDIAEKSLLDNKSLDSILKIFSNLSKERSLILFSGPKLSECKIPVATII